MLEMETYTVYYRNHLNQKAARRVTAFDKDDAKKDFMNRVTINEFKRITMVVKGHGMPARTPKQQLAHQYRSCIGAACMLEKNIQSILINSLAIQIKAGQARILALKQVAKCKRDIADMFKLMGLKIKHG